MSLLSRNIQIAFASTAIGLVAFNTNQAASQTPQDGINKAGVIYNGGATVSFDSTTLGKDIKAETTPTGKQSWGILAYKSSSSASVLNLTNSGNTRAHIKTKGNKAHGVQVGANGKHADGTDKSIISIADNYDVVTLGNDSWGLHAIDGGTINSKANVKTSGTNGFGVFAESYSVINLTGGTISTTGANGYGLIANNDRNAEAGKIYANNTTVKTDKDWTHGALAQKGAHIGLNGGSITTSGDRAFGILAAKGSTVTSSTAIVTGGDKAHGIQAGANGGTADGSDLSKITVQSGSSVSTTGNDAYGLHAIDGGSIVGTTDVETSGVNSYGAFAESYSHIELTGGNITTSGALAHGLLANNDRKVQGIADAKAGKITATGTKVTTSSEWTYGAFAKDGGRVDLNGGSITTSGERAFGLLAANGSTINSNAAISTIGLKAHGVQAGADGNNPTGADQSIITLSTGSVVETSGDDAFALHAIEGSKIEGSSTIKTKGTNGFGAFAESNSTISLHDTKIETHGKTAYGLIANNDLNFLQAGKIDAIQTDIVTSGNLASGIYAKAGGKVVLQGGSVTTRGEGASALEVVGNGTIHVEETDLISEKAPTITVGLDASQQIANVTFGKGTIATENNGTLLKVNRTQNGGDGIVNFTMKSGSVANGDVIDTDSTNTSGTTNFNIEQGAQYFGKIEGIKDVTAAHGSSLYFETGTVIVGNLAGTTSNFDFASSGIEIKGNVALNDGSVTRGGSVSNPIIVGGSLSSDKTSVIGGNWRIGQNLNANGIIRPGNSIGIVTVGGNATFGADSVYEVEVAGNGDSDKVNVKGKAILEGGRVDVYALDDKVSYKDGQTYTILTAEGGIDGKFSGATSKSIFLTTQLDQQANKIDLKVGVVADPKKPDPVVFEKVAQTHNQQVTARALDSLAQTGQSLKLYNSVLFLTDATQARSAFEQLSGDTHASAKTGFIDTANLTADTINNRIRSAFGGVATKDAPVLAFEKSAKDPSKQSFEAVTPVEQGNDYSVWATGFGSWTDNDGNASAGGLKTSTGGFLSGIDLGLAAGWRVGLVGGYSQTDIDAKNRNASTTSDNWHLGIYGGNQWGPIGLQTGLVHTWHNVDSSRSVAYPGFSDRLEADYDARTLQAFGELGYQIDTSIASFEPFANLSHIRLHTDGFKEMGGAAALSVESETTNTTFTTLGLRTSVPLNLGSTTASLKGTVGWRHAYGEVTPESTQFFTKSNAFTVEGTPIARDAALIEAGLDVAISETSSLGLSYVGQFGSKTTQNGFNTTFNVKF